MYAEQHKYIRSTERKSKRQTRYSIQCHLNKFKIIPSEKQYAFSRIHTNILVTETEIEVMYGDKGKGREGVGREGGKEERKEDRCEKGFT